MDFGLAFSYVFKDKDWFKKIVLPALCSLIPVVGQFVLSGWGLKATKNVIDGNKENALPDLEFGADLGRGFMAMVITFIYSLPAAILMGVAGGLVGFGANSGDDTLAILMYVVGGCLGLIGFLFALLVTFMGVVAIANYVAKGSFKAAFNFKEIFRLLKKAIGPWLLVILGQMLALGIIAPLGVIACVIGVFLTMAYGVAVYSHLLGQAYNKAAEPALGVVETL